MRNWSRGKRALLVLAFALVMMLALTAFAEGEPIACPDCEGAGTVTCATCEGAGEIAAPYESPAANTFWSLLPPIIAIGLALITKEVYSSLFVGILAGGLIYSNFNLERTFNTIISDGFVAKLADSWNVGILIFLVVLGIMVVVMQRAGGSAAYGRWASTKIKSRKSASFATVGLGCLIFVDDYFNCLTVGSVMRPITDKHNISRAKLSYIIDATAAPVCMIAPISSWAAAVTGVVEGYDGLQLFMDAIPYNFYSWLTIVMMIVIIALNLDFGPMKKHEKNAQEKGDLFTTDSRPFGEGTDEEVKGKGKVIDLVLPVVILIACCILGMVYTGGFFSGESFQSAFANCDAAFGLAFGSIVALLITFVFYMIRKVISFKDFMSAVPDGFRAMVPAILILTFAWTLSAMTGLLGADVFVAGLLEGSSFAVLSFLPAILFLIALGLAFSTGTSWGTFGILLPIIVPILANSGELLVIAVSACLAGAVCGDHCSPISDTTIMASTGGQCDHVNHVSTQLPYALLVAAVSFVFYIIAGFVQNAWIVLPIAIVAMVGILFLIKALQKRKAQ